MATDNKRKLYDALSEEYDMGSYEQFCSDLNDENKRRKLYEATSEEYDMGSWDSFSQQLGYGAASQTSASASVQTERNGAADFGHDAGSGGFAEAQHRDKSRAANGQTVTSFRMRRGGRDFSIPVEEVNAAGGLDAWAKAHPGAPIRVYMQGKNGDGPDFNGHVDLNHAHERNKKKGYKYQTVEAERFKPTEREKIGLSANLSRSMQQHSEAMQSIKDERKDVKEYAAKGNGMNFGQAVKSTPQLNAETGEMEDTWLTPDGKRTTSKAAADLESFNYRMATDMSIGGQLRRANERLADIEKRLDERGKELMAERDKNRYGGILGALMQPGQTVASAMTGQVYDPTQWPELTMDKDYQALLLASRKAREEIQKLQNAKERETHGERFWHDFGRATGQAIMNADAWDFGKGQLQDATTMMQLNKAVESGKELSKAENDALTELYLYDNVQNLYGDLGKGDRWGEIAGSSLSFMKDFLLTGGFSGVGTKIPTAVAKKVAFNAAKKMGTDLAGKKVAVEIAENGVLNYIRKGGKGAVGRLLASQGKAGLASTMAVKAIGVGAEDLLVRAPLMTFGVQGQSTAAKIIDTKLGPVSVDENTGELHFVNDKTWGEAAWQAGADQVIENYSEMWGAHIPAMSDVSKFFGARNLTAAVLRATRDNAGTVLSKTNKFLTRAGVNGYVGEVGEEYYGQLWRTMLDLDSAKDSEGNNLLGSGQFHGDIWGGMALSIGMTSAGTVAGSYGVQGAQKGVSSAIYLHHKKNMQKSAKRAATVFGADWENLQQLIDSQENHTMGAFAETVLADPDMTQQQKDAAMDYMEKAMAFRGYNLGELLRGKSGEENPQEQELSQSYMDGYEGASMQEMTDAYNMYLLHKQKLADTFADEGMPTGDFNAIMEDIDSDPVGAIDRTREDLKPMMLDYVNALMVYQGMVQRGNDDIDSQVSQLEWEIDANTNRKSGWIQPATMKLDDRQVYVVDGHIELLEDGNIDTANSDNTIIIRDAETGRVEFASPRDLLSMGEILYPAEVKLEQTETLRQELERQHADKMNGKLSFEPGTSIMVPIFDSEDQMTNATIAGPAMDEQGKPIDGMVVVQYEDGHQAIWSMQDLQYWADEANRVRVEAFEGERQRIKEEQAPEDTVQGADLQTGTATQRPAFALNDEFTILDQESGKPVYGTVTDELDEDGMIEIYTGEPLNGSLVNKIRPEELEGMLDTYNGDAVVMPSARASAQIESEGDTEFGLKEIESAGDVDDGFIPIDPNIRPDENGNIIIPEGSDNGSASVPEIASADVNTEDGLVAGAESSGASPTAMERIPRNEKGEPVFEQAETPELGWDALVEARGGDLGKAQVVADMMAEIKRKAYEKLQKQKPKGNTPSEIIASQDAIDAELAQAELEYKQWQDIANVERVRQAAIQAEQEAAEREAAELAAAEEAERKALEKADKRFGEVYDKVKGNALAVERLRQLEPETIYEAASAVLSRGKILWDNNGGSRGLKQETGYGEGERKKMFSMFATKENGGRSLRRLAEDEMQETCALAGIPYDNVDAFNALTEVISEAQLPSDIRNYIKNRRIEQALEIYDHEQAAERAAYEEWCYQNFGMSAEEYEAYEEQREEEIRNALENFDENEYFSNIADELIERENERRRVEEAVIQGESTGDGGSVEVLSTQGTDTQGGTIKDAERQGVPEGDGNQVVDTTGAVPEGASGGEGEQIASIGFGKFGQIFAAFRGKAKEAWRYLSALQSGQARGVFYRPEIGEIDLVWGDAPTPYSGKGLAHIDRKHVETLGDFSSMEEAIDTIDDVITNGEYIEQDSRTAIFDKGNYRVVVAREESGNWVLTAFDNKTSAKEKKKRKDAATTGTAGQPNAEARAVASNLSNYIRQKDASSEGGASSISHAEQAAPAISLESRDDALSDGKDNTLLSDKQEVEGESSGNDAKASTSVQQAVEAASAEVNTEPTPAQAEAGNYKKGHVTIGEFDITIENPAGSQRKGVDANGKEWHTTMANAYGYIKGTEGVDGDHIDVFLHSDMDQWNGRKVYVVDQTNTDGSFDEHKVMLGFNDKDEAMSAYLANYDKTWSNTHPGLRISETNIEDFNKWVQSSHRKTKPFAEYSTVSKVTEEAPKPRPHKWVSAEDADEFESLRDGLRDHFGKSTDMINEAESDYGKPKPKPMDAEVLRMGTRMTYLMMKGGLRKFSDYCEAMKEELPEIFDDIRPHLKSLYAAAQNMEEVMGLGWDEEMDDRKTVKAFDVYNFDKTGPKDIISTAQHIVDEQASQQAVDALKIGKEKNKRRKTEQRAALTSGLFDQIETENEKRTNVQPGAEDAGRGGQQPRPNESLGEGAEHEDERTDGGRMAQRGREYSVSDSDRGAGVSGLHQSERGVTASRTPVASKNTRNNHAERGTDYAPKGEKARIDANIAALELAKKLLASGATATPQEMAILRRYSGWGGLGAAFNEGSAWAPNPINKRLREALTPEEYQAAVMSRNSAYYTPAAVIDAMWDVAKALGFKSGNIVEGSAGIGNIIGLMPTDISERSNIHAVEIDPITGGILSLLYPDAKVEVQGFEQTRIANGSVDLAITNVPFVTDLHVKDETGDGDLSKKFRDIHDFCIAKNVRKLREGGIGIFITSSGTLDKSQKLRNWLVGDKEGNADVVGVFRMNNQTFGGTDATSDIVVIRKRVNGRKSSNAIDVSTVTPARTVTFIDDRGREKDLPLFYNRYFIEHPEFMGGEMAFNFEQGVTWRPKSFGLFPTSIVDQSARMAAWVQHLADMDWSKEQGKAVAEQTSHINEALGEGIKEGSMVTDSEGNLCVARMGRAVPLALNKNKIKGRTKEECFKDYTEIKSALADVLKYQTEHEDDAGLQPLLDRLNRAYDTFVQRYGNLNKNNNLAWLRNDVDFSSIVALETYSEKGNKDGTKVKTYGKTDIFSHRVVEKESEPTPKNVKDGIIASIYKYGRIDTEYLAAQLGKSQDDVKQEIVDSGLGFVDPTTGQMEVSYEYLSGNVREKLRQAREANEAAGGAYDANIKALEAVVPMNIPAHLIEFALGSSWIKPQLYERYVKERTELDVKLTNAGGTWHMSEPWNTDKPKNTEMGVRSEAFGILIPGHKLIEAALTNKSITVSRTVKDSDGGSHTETDPAATTACATKVDEIRQDFKDWAREQMQNDPALSMHMEEKYNEKFNNSVPKFIPDEFVPEHFGGAATTVGGKPFKLRPHQAKAVIRATTQPVLLAHEVGTGKTYTLITTAMEMRRLGTARKPMIVVQNATVGQFVASAKALYPNAKVLTLEDADRNAEGRRAFYAKIKFNDWDMIVVPQSVFERIPDSIERQTQFIQDKIEEKMLVLEQMKDADPDGRSMIVRAAEREISRLEDEMSQLAGGEDSTSGKKKKDAKKEAITRQNAEVKARELLDRATDDVEDFDSMGIDAILVDEAHEYKHLGFATAMQRGVKGVDPSPSKKSQGVFLKTQAVLEKTGGKNVVFATGTPISNTAAEIWTFMRYLIPADVMKEYDIYYFDDFVRNFGNLQQMLEFKTNGKYDEVNRFAGYVNLPELVRIWSTVADTVLTREAGGVSDKIPQMEGGKAQDIFLPQTRALRSIMKFVKEELDRYENMTGKAKKENSHIPLVMYGIAKAAAVDGRLVQSDAEDDPNSKTNEAVRQTLRTLEETKEYKGTVAIFADNYQNKHSGFNLYEDIRRKLIAAGVPEEQVVVMKSGMTVKKKFEIFDKVNAGEIRVVMGSTFTLGTGVNIQERLHTLIHLDAPNRPMDYTQRNGRILRQGNLHNTWGLPVRVLRFGVEDSLDVTAYQRLKTKGAIADSIMNGKQLLANPMENRSLEEDQDLFGDITAQLSGSEYAMLKNQIEKEVRKLRAAEKNWKADQTYIHNRKRQIAGQNRETEKRIADNQSYLDKVEAATIGDITVGKFSFPSVEAMEDFFTEQNKKKAAMQEEVRTSGYSSRPATSDITISVGGFDFKIHTEITKEMKHQQGDLFATAPAKMTYSCPELGIDAMPVRGNAIKNAVLDIMENVVSGKDFRERIANAENYLERNNAELEAISKRDGQPFKDAEALEKAEEKLAEYEELMKAEMAAKEAKYAEMDKEVEAAAGIELTEEDSEPTASEPGAGYGSRRKATVTGRSLFDWADDEEKAQQAMIAGQADDVDKATSAALREADVALDRYAEAYNDYLDHAVSMDSQLESEGVDDELRQDMMTQLEDEETKLYELKEKLEETLRLYYELNNTHEDALKIARDMVCRVEAEVATQHNKNRELEAILEKANTDASKDKENQAKGRVKTGGGYISYAALGHLPNPLQGEFSYVERQFSQCGEFSFTGNEVVRDRGDVAYIFRALESYAIEHVFAAFVKDGRVKVLHIGMGGPTSSYADLGAIRAGYDAFGADMIYLVHNHPSGNLTASGQDMSLMRKLRAAFKGIPTEGIIIDTTSGRYRVFDGDGMIGDVVSRPESGGENAPDVVRFDHNERTDSDTEPVYITGPKMVEEFIGKMRFGTEHKVSYLVLSNSNEIIGNFHTGFESLADEGLAQEIGSVTTKYAGRRAIVYGNARLDETQVRQLKKRIKEHSLESVELLDVLGEIKGTHASANDNGMMEPGAEYGNSLAERIGELAGKLHLENVEVVTDTATLEGKRATAKGFYNKRTGKITIVLPNNLSMIDAEQTLLHEAVAHYGLRQLFGDRFDTFLDNVFESAEPEIRRKIASMAREQGWNIRTATEEYLAGLAEDTDFEAAKEHAGWWTRIKQLFIDMVEQLGFDHFRDRRGMVLTDNELRYILWKSYENLAKARSENKTTYLDEARDIAKQAELGVGNYAETGIEAEPGEDGELFRPGDFTPRDKVTARDAYERMLKSGRFQFTEAMQDSMLGLKELYKAVSEAKSSGRNQPFRIEDIAGFENAYLYENAMSSRNNSHAHRYFLSYMQPLLKEIGKICGANEQKRRDLIDYMMAKHGLERNEYMRNEAINNGEDADRDFAGLTGLTKEKDWQTAEAVAQQWVDDYEAKIDTTALWKAINNATKATLWTVYQSGMISKETHDKIAGMYAYYIPLRGWDETTSDEVYGYLTSNDGPLNGSIMKSAEGRSSMADDPIATIAKMADDAIRQGNRNVMKQRFLNFVLNHPSDLVSVHDLWLEYDDVTDEWRPVFADINDTDTPAEVEQKVEAFEARMEALRTTKPDKYKRGREAQGIPYKVVKGNLREHQVLVKRNGQTTVLTINGNPRAAQALNGLTNPDVETGGVIGNLLKVAEWTNRQLSAFYTTRNPDFVVGNFFRDMLYSNCMMWVKESPRYARRFHKNFARVNPVTMRKLLGKWEQGTLNQNNMLERMFEQFMLNGGETGYTNVKDIEGHKRAVAAELRKLSGQNIARKGWTALGMQLDLLNRSAENCARFAAFVTSREFGRSIDRSIYDAKEVSVNFNKKGSGGKMINATGQTKLGRLGGYLGGIGRLAWVFWNAGLQGMTNFGRQAKRHPGKFIGGAATMFALGAIIPMLAQMLWGDNGDDDDKNAYYNLPEYVRRSNICVRAGDQWITIPLPIEFRAIYGLGELGYGVISGNERYSNEKLAHQTAAQVSQILPLDMLEGGGGFQALIPSVFKPGVEALMNKGWTGLPVYKDTPYNKEDPEWTKAYASADKHLVGASKWLNEATGGDDFKKGAIDINPAKVEYLLNGTFGGVFTFPMKLKKSAETAMGAREFEWRNMPIANRLVKSGDERTANRKLREEYFKYKNEYESTGRLIRKYENAEMNDLVGYAEKVSFLEQSPEYARWEVFDSFKEEIDATQEALKAETDAKVKKELEAEQYEEMRALVDALKNPKAYWESVK